MAIKSSKTLVNEAMNSIETLDASKAKELFDKNECTLIDIRDIRELWNEGFIDGSLHIPRGMLEFWMDPDSPYYKKEKFDENKKKILFCAGGLRSALATKTLADMGYKNIAHIEGGYQAMSQSGFNISQKDKE